MSEDRCQSEGKLRCRARSSRISAQTRERQRRNRVNTMSTVLSRRLSAGAGRKTLMQADSCWIKLAHVHLRLQGAARLVSICRVTNAIAAAPRTAARRRGSPLGT